MVEILCGAKTSGCSGRDFINALGEGKKVVDFAANIFDKLRMSKGKSYKFGLINPRAGISTDEVMAEVVRRDGSVDESVECALVALALLTPDDFARLKVRVILIMHKPVTDCNQYVDRMGIILKGDLLMLTTYDDGKDCNTWREDVGFLYCKK